MIDGLRQRNEKLATFKGTGKITIYEKKKKGVITRVAWIGAVPERLRILVRNITGQPLINFAFDGKWLYLFLHHQEKYYKKQSKNLNLERFISIPVKIIDMVTVLSGRIPVIGYNTAQLFRYEKNGYVLILAKNDGTARKIYLDKAKKYVRKIELFNGFGSLVYRVIFKKFKNIDGYQIPFYMNFSDDKGSGFKLDIDRYWANVPVLSSMFVLSKPESK